MNKLDAKPSVHPLQKLPRSPWRSKVRSIFFPILHRQWMVSQEMDLAEETPHDLFENFMVVAIFANFVALAAFDPFNQTFDSGTFKNLFIIQAVLSIVFLIELTLRTIACGVRYMIDPLRLLDSISVLIGVGALMAEFAGAETRLYGVTIVRTLRILRPLQQITLWPSVTVLINAFQSIFYRLTDASLLFVLFVLLFAVAGVPQFSGLLRTRCVSTVYTNTTLHKLSQRFYKEEYLPALRLQYQLRHVFRGETPLNKVVDEWHKFYPTGTFYNESIHTDENLAPLKKEDLVHSDFVCGAFWESTVYPALMESTNASWNGLKRMLHDKHNPHYPSSLGCSTLQVCDNTGAEFLEGYKCPQSYECQAVHNPFDDLVSFDNFGLAMLTMYTSTTMQLWYEVAYFAHDATSHLGSWYMNIFIVVTGFLIVSVFLVLVAVEFEKAKREQREEIAMRKDTAKSKFHTLVQDLVRANRAAASEKQQDEGDIDPKIPTVRSKATSSFQRGVVTMRLFLRDYVTQREWFFYACALVILINIALLGSVHYGMSDSTLKHLADVNSVITVLYTIELIIRFLADEPKKFFTSVMHMFDLFIVIMCYVDMATDNWNFTFIRAFRIIRAASVLQIFPNVYHWVQYILKCLLGAPVVLGVMFMVIAIFGVMCMHLLGGRFCNMETELLLADNMNPHCPMRPRANFDTFVNAMITSFQIITADDWNYVMYNAMKARGDFIAIIFVMYFFIGNFILISLLIGTMLSVHDDETASELVFKDADDKRKKERKHRASVARKQNEDDVVKAKTTDAEFKRNRGKSLIQAVGNGDSLSHGLLEELQTNPNMIEVEEVSTHEEEKKAMETNFQSELGYQEHPVVATYSEKRQIVKDRMSAIMDHKAMDIFSGLVIVLWTISMAVENPLLAPNYGTSYPISIIYICCIVYFVLESVGYVLAYGIIRGKDAYLRRSMWNVFDFFLMLIGIVVLILKYSVRRSQAAYIVQSLLSLRPLSLIKRSQSMSLVLAAMGNAVLNMRYVVSAIFLMYVFFAVVGVQILVGKMQFCHGPNMEDATVTLLKGDITRQSVHVDIPYRDFDLTNCTLNGGTWRNDGLNFDNVGEALLTLYSVSTLEMWAEVMYLAMDYEGEGLPPHTNAYQFAALYFIVWAAFSGLFLVAILTTVLVDSYNKEIRSVKAQESLLVSREHNGWLLTNRRLLRCLPGGKEKKKNNASKDVVNAVAGVASQALELVVGDVGTFRAKVRTFVRSEFFIRVSLFVIFLNFCFSAAQHYPQTEEMDRTLFAADIIFTTLFCLEALVKMWAETPAVYIAAQWNKFDLFVATTSLVLVATQGFYKAKLSATVRCLRILRVTRILKGRSAITQLMQQFGHALMCLGPITAVILIFFFSFSIMGKNLFGRLVWKSFDYHSINHNINFQNMASAMNLLLRLSTGGDWLAVFRHSTSTAKGCLDRIGDCGPPDPIPQAFYFLYMLLSIHVLKNLLVAVMLDSFSAAANQRGITKRDALLLHFKWLGYDPTLRMSINAFDVLPLIRSLPAECPISLNGKKHRIQLEFRFLLCLKIRDPTRERIKFRAVIDLLCRFSYQISPPPSRIFKFDFSKPRTLPNRSIASNRSSRERDDSGSSHKGSYENVQLAGVDAYQDGDSEVDDGVEEEDMISRKRLFSVIPGGAKKRNSAVRLRGQSFAGRARSFSGKLLGEGGDAKEDEKDDDDNGSAFGGSFAISEQQLYPDNPSVDDTYDYAAEEELYKRSAALIMLNGVIVKRREKKRELEAEALGFSLVQDMRGVETSESAARAAERNAFDDHTSVANTSMGYLQPEDEEEDDDGTQPESTIQVEEVPRGPAPSECELLGFSVDEVLKRARSRSNTLVRVDETNNDNDDGENSESETLHLDANNAIDDGMSSPIQVRTEGGHTYVDMGHHTNPHHSTRSHTTVVDIPPPPKAQHEPEPIPKVYGNAEVFDGKELDIVQHPI